MNSKMKVLMVALILAACSRGAEEDTERTAARDTAVPEAHDMSAMTDSAADTTSMSGMDHSQMPGMQPTGGMTGMQRGGQATGGAMAGMDHSQMPNMPSRGRQAMAGMDHAQMQNAPARGQQPMPGMDHARMNMPTTPTPTPMQQQMPMQHQMPMQQQPQAARPPAGMQMAPPADPPAPEDAALEKIRALIAELVRDPRIQARIQADTALRRLWQDAGVQQYLMKRP